jgi:MFS family permease
LVGLGYGTLSSSGQAISIKVSPKERMGLATSTWFIFLDGGIGIGPFILGFLIPLMGYRGLYLIMGIIVFACLFLYYFLHGRKAGKKNLPVDGNQEGSPEESERLGAEIN